MCKYTIFDPNSALLSRKMSFYHKMEVVVTLFSGASFSALDLQHGNALLTMKTMKQITAFGDSIMRGVVLDGAINTATPRYALLDENFSARCGEQLGVQIANHGRFGNTTRHGLRELERRGEQIAASDFVVMEFGGNDCDHHWQEIADNPKGEHHPIASLELFEQQYVQLIAGIRSLGSSPVLLSMPPIISDRYFEAFSSTMNQTQRRNVLDWLGGCIENITRWHELYNLKLFKLASDLGVPIIDITSPFLFERNYREFICQDGIHPNARGHRLIADTICRVAAGYL